ncbi:FtsK/SpoIIIE domain-containing protein [Arthrobacter sp. UYEF3]|uniref:FtsK/SpoIIIE domain-containing protein n=1 Tax=Arthrobacter sp. UYEF3 TaxID=1756365 RepID=UPI0033929576
MLLQCTLVGEAGSAILAPLELSVGVGVGCSGAALQDALAGTFGTARLRIGGTLLGSLTVGTFPLVNGAVLVDGRPASPPPRGDRAPGGRPASSGAPLLLAVLSGPGAGTVLQLRRGSYRIGRSGTELALPDTELSREHARLDVSDSGITVVDLGSANGTRVDGRRVSSAPVSTDSLIGCGNSTLAVLFREQLPGKSGPGMPGLEAAGRDTSEQLRVTGPGPAGPRTLLVPAVVAPLVVGVALAVVTGMWMFLAFTAMSAVPALVPAVSGRKQHRELNAAVAAAVRLDQERRRQAAPSAPELLLGAANPADTAAPAPIPAPQPAEAGPVWLRLGLAEQTAKIRLEPADPGFRAPTAGLLPLTLDPSVPTRLEGPPQAVAGLVRFFVMQLASYPRGGRTWIHLHGPAASIPLAARFLARVSLSASTHVTAATLTAGPGPGCERGVLILLPGTTDPASLLAEACRLGWQVVDCSCAASPAAGQTVTFAGCHGRLTCGSAAIDFLPDQVPDDVFDRFCRQTAAADGPVGAPSAVPALCSLDDVLPLSEADVSLRWAADGRLPGRSPGLPVPVGRDAAGVLRIDLQADGPHLLVAGTTGAGKSEFLRTLVAGLAACYPPDRVSLLFVDFKGGSGLGPLSRLPHCVGLLTDLDSYEVDRTLASLRAEVRRREELLAEAEVPDLASYQARAVDFPALPHLVLIIDEFRMLVEDAPAALTELMRIAVIGRSLGIHLVMATQRPQGALTADIRANVTSCVVLRVQSELESADVMNSRLAATIPIALPGRAYLVRGNGAPEEFQTAVLGATPPLPAAGTVTVMTAQALLDQPQAAAPTTTDQERKSTPVEAALPFVELASRLWHLQGGAPTRRPVAEPLPPVLTFPAPAAAPAPAPAHLGLGTPAVRDVMLGVVDLPEQQRIGRLSWNPDLHGHLALIGGTQNAVRGGSLQALRLVLDQLEGADVESHLYLLDGDGALARAATSPRVGAWVGPQEPRRAVRVLARIAEEMTRRLAAPVAGKPVPLVLALHSWGSWVSEFRSGPLAWAEDLVHDIIRDGPKADITVVLSGERELVTARFFAALPNRVYFPLGSTEESRLAWPPLPHLPDIPGRVVVSGMSDGNRVSGERGMSVGKSGPAAIGRALGNGLQVAQLYEPPEDDDAAPSGGRCTNEMQSRPFRIEALPAVVTADEVRSRLGPADGPARNAPAARAARSPDTRLWIGVSGDELLPVSLTLPPGGVLAVLGRAGSGKTSLLRALGRLNPSRTWLAPQPGAGQDDYWSGVLAQAGAGNLDRSAVLLADDVDLCGRQTNDSLLELNSLGWTVVFSAGFGPALPQRVPLALPARSQGKGILIGPRSLMDGDLFGVRFEPESRPPAGRAVVISDGAATAVQLALAPEQSR